MLDAIADEVLENSTNDLGIASDHERVGSVQRDASMPFHVGKLHNNIMGQRGQIAGLEIENEASLLEFADIQKIFRHSRKIPDSLLCGVETGRRSLRNQITPTHPQKIESAENDRERGAHIVYDHMDQIVPELLQL